MSTNPSAAPTAIGTRRELFIDDALIENLSGDVRRQLHHPQPREVVLRFDQPWEGTGCGYCSLFQDGDRYRLYYKGFNIKVQPGKIVSENIAHRFTCYAESADGIHWTKPELGQFEFNGSRANNIVLNSAMHGPLKVDAAHPAIFKDANPACPPEARYKGIFRSDGPPGLVVMQSPDGLRWKPFHDQPVITHGAFDSQNLAFWDELRGEYRAYWRCFPGGVTEGKENWHPEGPRSIRTATSPDLVRWNPDHDLTYTGSPEPEELYVNQIKPYHRAPHLFIGFPARYVERPWGASLRALPDREHRERRSSAQMRYGTALTESVLMCSRDGVEFTRWPEGFLRPGPERSGTWNYGHQYLAWHLVETPSSFAPDGPPELSLYATEDYWLGQSGSVLRRYTLRLDGFVSLQAPHRGGEALTKPVTFSGHELRLNFATSVIGDVRVELQDLAGQPLPGFALDDCEPTFGDAIDRPVVWRDQPDLARHAGHPVRLRFALRDADLFAYRFVNG